MAVDLEVYTETVGLLGTGAQDVHLHFHTALSLYVLYPSFVRSTDEFRAFKVSKKKLTFLGGCITPTRQLSSKKGASLLLLAPKREASILRKNACIKSIIRTQKRASLRREKNYKRKTKNENENKL